MIELLIQNRNTVYQPVIEGEPSWETCRKGSPGKLTFSVYKDSLIDFQEGNPVRFKKDGKKVFYGFVFKKDRDNDKIIKVTAYDQLRYFKNKDTYVYKNKTADEFIKMIAGDFHLRSGKLDATGFKIPARIEDNKTLFDMVQTALDLTLQNNKKLYVLYDDFGFLTLRNIENMKLDLLIDEETGESFSYSSSIDGDTYNKIKLSHENKKAGKREIYISQDSENMNAWGVLQYFETINEKINGKEKADALLQLYNKKTRSLTINNSFGDIRVRGGSLLAIKLNLGDVIVSSYMMVEKVTHKFTNEHHTMDLTLRGGEFIA